MKTSELSRKISYPSYAVTISNVKTAETDLGQVDFVELRTPKRDASKRLKHAPQSPSEHGSEIDFVQRPSDPLSLGGLVACSSLLFTATIVGAFFFWTAPYFNKVYGFTMDASR